MVVSDVETGDNDDVVVLQLSSVGSLSKCADGKALGKLNDVNQSRLRRSASSSSIETIDCSVIFVVIVDL